MTSFSTMSFKRFIVALFVSLLCGSMVLAAPLPVDHGDVHPGHILQAKPKHFIPGESKTAGKHPVVVLSHPDANGHVHVGSISHNHAEGSHTASATDYGLPSHQKDGHEHHINLAPKKVHHDHLSHITSTTHPLHGHSVSGDHLTNLHSHTGTG